MRHFRARARVRYDDDVANDDSDSDDDSDFCARGDATHRTRVRVETIDDDALVQVRTVASCMRALDASNGTREDRIESRISNRGWFRDVATTVKGARAVCRDVRASPDGGSDPHRRSCDAGVARMRRMMDGSSKARLDGWIMRGCR